MLIVTFHNDSTGDVLEGNYDVKVYVNRNEIWSGRVEGHDRLTGWEGLLKRLAGQVKERRIDK